jgi:IMP dehydrogenase
MDRNNKTRIFMNFELALDFDDVMIVPKHSDIESRKTVDTTSITEKLSLKLPVISSNMKTITEWKMCKVMAENGGMGILHRFMSTENILENLRIIRLSPSMDYGMKIGASIGVQTDDKFLFDKLYEHGARMFCVDVAHGHHLLVKRMINWLKNKMLDITIIAGNVATPDGAKFLIDEGADIVKVGIGGGKVCRTRGNTGVGVPTFHSIRTIREACPNSILIADGGIDTPGKVAKALKYADFVMLGNMLSGTAETPGNVYRDEDGGYYKVYQGSASGENKNSNNTEAKFVEGITKQTMFRGKVKYILREIQDGIQSAFSYVGARNMKEFKEKCEFVRVTPNTKIK